VLVAVQLNPATAAVTLAAQIAALAARVGALEGKPAPTPAPGKPAKPTGMACAIGQDGRPDLRWEPADGVVAWEIHDLSRVMVSRR